MENRIGNYIFEKVIGTGTFASVKLARNVITQNLVAVKVLPKDNLVDLDSLARFQREVNLLKDLDHPLIAEFYELLDDDFNFYILMEYVANGNLLDFVNNSGELSEKDARHYFSQLICVLEYLHEEKSIAHRDLKAENVLLDRHNNIRLIDFGLSNIFTTGNPMLKTACGSPAYAPPEMIKGEKYDVMADIWSAGILLYAMIMGELPFEDDNMQRLLQKIVYTEPKYPSSISPSLKDLFQKILTKDPKARATIYEIKTHPWFTGFGHNHFFDNQIKQNPLLKIFCSDNGKLLIDENVINEIQEYGIDTSNLENNIKHNRYDHVVALYRMIKKERIIENMRTLSTENEQMSKKTAGIVNQRMLRVPLPALRVSTTRRSTEMSSPIRSPSPPVPEFPDKPSSCPNNPLPLQSSPPSQNTIKILTPGGVVNSSQRKMSANIVLSSPIQLRRRSNSMREGGKPPIPL